MDIEMEGTSFFAGDPAMLEYFGGANIQLVSGDQPSPSDSFALFYLAMPVPEDEYGDWYAYEVTASTGELIEYMRARLLEEIGAFYGVDLPAVGGKGLYDCDFAQLAHLWHSISTDTPFSPGSRRLTALEMAHLLKQSTGFQEAVRAEFVQKGAEGAWESWDHSKLPTPLLLDGYGVITTPDVSKCVSTGTTLPGGETVPPGLALPENKEPPPAGIDPMRDLDAPKAKSSVWPWVGAGVVAIGLGLIFTRKG